MIEKVTFLAFHVYPWNTRGRNDRTHVLKIAPKPVAQPAVWPDEVLVSRHPHIGILVSDHSLVEARETTRLSSYGSFFKQSFIGDLFLLR